MLSAYRHWIKIIPVLGMLLGCNVLAPAVTAATQPDYLIAASPPCHQQKGDKGGGMTVCGKACLALPVTALIMMKPAFEPEIRSLQTSSLLADLAQPPATPPPRSLATPVDVI